MLRHVVALVDGDCVADMRVGIRFRIVKRDELDVAQAELIEDRDRLDRHLPIRIDDENLRAGWDHDNSLPRFA